MTGTATIHTAMIMAAGYGKRMAPLSDTVPKPLIPLAGKPLIDHALDRIAAAGIRTAIVNVHYLADQIEAHLAGRTMPRIVISDERELLLETGGGIRKALPLLGTDPILTFNSDSVWVEGRGSNLQRLIAAWDPDRMDALLMLAPTVNTIGEVNRGDFSMDQTGRLKRRPDAGTVPFMFAGVQIIKPELFKDGPSDPFSTNLIWDRLLESERLYGQRMEGMWMHVGTPGDLARAENFLQDL